MLGVATVTASFSASHQIEKHSTCGRGDGHLWTVTVGVQLADAASARLVVDHGELLGALAAITRELDHRYLNDMLPGVVASPEGVAAYVHERLSLDWPFLTRVRVSADAYAAELEWTIR